jgi:hypothetical protein
MTRLSILILLFNVRTYYCQIPNPGFETWVNASGFAMPAGWSGSGYGLDSSSNAHSGNYAASIWTWYTYAPGYIVNGNDPQSFDYVKSGTPINYKPSYLEGYYHFDSTNVYNKDSALVYIILKRYNTSTNTRDTVGLAYHKLPFNLSYQYFSVPITDKMPGLAPDSIVVLISTQDRVVDFGDADNTCNNGVNTCAYLYIDDLALSSPAAIRETKETQLNVYPNPASANDFLYVRAPFGVLDLTIRNNLGETFTLPIMQTSSGLAVSTKDLQSGVYFIELRDTKVIRRTKVIIR